MSAVADSATDRPIFVPTPEGPLGGILSEPAGEIRAGVFLLPGYGRPGRSGTNSFWTRLARELAGHGLLALRVDYTREGETIPTGEACKGPIERIELEMRLFGEAMRWLRRRLGDRELYLAGACSGGRAAIDLAGGSLGSEIARTFLVVPNLRTFVDPADADPPDPPTPADGQGQDDPEAVDPSVVGHLRAILARGACPLLAGEGDSIDLDQLQRRLGPTDHELELAIVPGMALHFLDQPEVQEQARAWLVGRIADTLGT